MSRLRCSVAALGLLFVGCSGETVASPPAILYGADVCDACRMVISEERHAAAARIGDRELRFDDPGCLQRSLRAKAPGAGAVAWVHDETGTWLPVEEAWFAVDAEGATPMASGMLAFSSQEAARAARIRSSGDPGRWSDVVDAAEGQQRNAE